MNRTIFQKFIIGLCLFEVTLGAAKISADAPRSSSAKSGAKAGKTKAGQDRSNSNPRLIVLLIVDQMRADTLQRYEPALRQISAGQSVGLLGLRDRGANFTLASTAGAPTVTAAGHASLCTGASPSKHGIVGNEIFDPVEQQVVASTADKSAGTLVTQGLLPDDPLSRIQSEGSSARRMITPNLADALFEWSGGKSKTVSVSIKDRGAAYCGGKNAAGVYWYDYKSGSMVSSTSFTRALPDWVNSFNKNRQPDFSKEWKSLLPPEDMRRLLADEKSKKTFLVRTPLSQWFGNGFPYVPEGKSSKGIAGRQHFQFTPAASNHLADFAVEAVRQERLGCASRKSGTPCTAPEKPDLLTISFSSTDLVGHTFGPESPELMDIYLNLNATVERLKVELEKSLGNAELLYVFSSDHGVQSLPEVLLDQGQSAGRLVSKDMRTSAENILQAAWGEGPWISAIVTNEIHLRRDTLSKKQKSVNDAVALLKIGLKSHEGIRGFLSRDEIVSGQTPETEHYRRGLHTERSGDAVILLNKGWLVDKRNAANHGTAFDEDTRIPIVFSGWNIKNGITVSKAARADDVAPTILGLIGSPRPAAMTGQSFAAELISKKSK
ncbi:MAG: hypothetical protein EBR09_15380 [Proteobacteria bacterium]|nr:hypothetical protein [Pseudomonadota bacterium]